MAQFTNARAGDPARYITTGLASHVEKPASAFLWISNICITMLAHIFTRITDWVVKFADLSVSTTLAISTHWSLLILDNEILTQGIYIIKISLVQICPLKSKSGLIFWSGFQLMKISFSYPYMTCHLVLLFYCEIKEHQPAY